MNIIKKIISALAGTTSSIYERSLTIATDAMRLHAEELAAASAKATEKATELSSEYKQTVIEASDLKSKEKAVRARLAKLEGLL